VHETAKHIALDSEFYALMERTLIDPNEIVRGQAWYLLQQLASEFKPAHLQLLQSVRQNQTKSYQIIPYQLDLRHLTPIFVSIHSQIHSRVNFGHARLCCAKQNTRTCGAILQPFVLQ
jgi:malate synthase